MKKTVKIILITALVLGAVFAACSAYMNGIPVTHKGLDYAQQYRTDAFGDCVYFAEADFGDYENITYAVKDRKGLFRSVGSMYTVTYSEEQYTQQLEKINALNFLDASCQQGDRPVIPYIIPAEKVEAGGWLVRVLNLEDQNNYPKQIAMIATNDETNTIAYMYFSDPDLDFVSETAGEDELKRFIEKNFCFTF